ncbi:MAG: septum formation initiator family protein [Nitrospirae bacterium]|jgi:cell division protein FtsB|nr:septum formation initiator family protein [Nitrospirota bacterium]
MGTSSNLLRKQVISEIRKRRLVLFTFILLSFIYVSISLIFGDMGFLRHRELHKTKINLEKQIKEIENENEQLKTQINSLEEDPFYMEKHAREDFGLAKPDEYIFLYDR